jgi:hypothetical protein
MAARMSSFRISHLRQIHPKLPRELMQHTATDQRHYNHKKDLEGVLASVVPQLMQQVPEFMV